MDNPKDGVFERHPIGRGTGPDAATPVEGGAFPSLKDLEQRHIACALDAAHGNQRQAARILGISRWSLARRLRKYGIQPRTAA
jgi:DNA-binding NtrC family response regulator